MAFQSVWYETELPNEIIQILEAQLEEKFNTDLKESVVVETKGNNQASKDVVNTGIRKAKNAWLSSNHWITGFVMHFVNLANTQNFCYDLTGLDGQVLQYTVYDKGEFYNWHSDQGIGTFYKPESNQKHGYYETLLKDKLNINAELVRKLSFSLQLSDEKEYKGGELQIMDESDGIYEVPKRKGLLVCFDSRARHRVNKVTSGRRKSLVGWVVGPRWR
jgi:Rps23 Pro-64 3,4-dihydroxylase Tpa1-like proline 4-hydroxylase